MLRKDETAAVLIEEVLEFPKHEESLHWEAVGGFGVGECLGLVLSRRRGIKCLLRRSTLLVQK